MTDLPIPGSASEVTPAWMTAALKAGGLDAGGIIIDLAATPIGDAIGLMGEITKFELTWDESGQTPTSVVLKVPSVLEDNRALGMMLGVYEGEHRAYSEISHDLGVAAPRCWYSAGDAEQGRYALVIEDLTGHDRVDQLDGADLATAEACVDALAEFNARWWESDRLAALDWLPDGSGEATRVYHPLVASALPDYEQSHRTLLSDEDRAVCHRFVDEYDRLIDLSLTWPNTLMHRDYRIDNILFDGGTPVVLDWGNLARGSGLYDLAYFLSGSLTIENRRAWGDDLLGRYSDRLAARGFAYDDFQQRHREAALYCLIVTILLGGDGLDARDEKGERWAGEQTLRLFSYLHDHDAVTALD